MQTSDDRQPNKLRNVYLLQAAVAATIAAALGFTGGAIGRASTPVLGISITFATVLLALAVSVALIKSAQTIEMMGVVGMCYLFGFVVFLALGMYSAVHAFAICTLSKSAHPATPSKQLCSPFFLCCLISFVSSFFWAIASLLTLNGRYARPKFDAVDPDATPTAQ